MIEVKGLYKSFDDKTVLSDINATFENGKTNLIIGQSGSGKTVLMKCIVGLLTPEKVSLRRQVSEVLDTALQSRLQSRLRRLWMIR